MDGFLLDQITRELVESALFDEKGKVLPWSSQKLIAENWELSYRTVERIALENGILPSRYQRNRQTISVEQQLKLFDATVAVIGCGGLGGYVIEELARLGVGRIVAIDPDVFEEHNLNRQLLATIETLGKPKVEAAALRVAMINPSVEVVAVREYVSEHNGKECLGEASVAVDALDNIPSRMALAKICREQSIPLIHGAIAGWYGHVCVQMPKDRMMESLYKHAGDTGIEQQWGNPSFTPAVVASLEVAETCKILLQEGMYLQNKVLTVNLLEMEFECVDVES